MNIGSYTNFDIDPTMFELDFFTVFLCATAAVPVLLVLRTLAIEARRRHETAPPSYPYNWQDEILGYTATESASVADMSSFERTHRHLRATARCEVDRPLRTNVHAFSSDTTAGTLNPSAFEYTIRRHTGAAKQEALNMGGFSQVPLLLYDRSGNCFTVHRRLSLN